MNEPEDAFAVLGLPARRDLTDEDVRAAWRRIAAVTHPDLEDGGDPARFSAAAAAYDTLRTSFGRGEALADLGFGGHRAASRRFRRSGRHRRQGRTAGSRTVAGARILRHLRYAGLAYHVRYAGLAYRGRGAAPRLAGAVAAVTAVAVAGWTPATIALLVGAATWLAASHGRRP